MKKTSTERSSERDARMREAGFTQRKVWAHPGDWVKIHSYVLELNSERKEYKKMCKEMWGIIE